MKTTIQVSTLKAAICAASEKDLRSYLIGVHFHFLHSPERGPRLHIVATDGAMLFAAREQLEYLEGAQTADFSFTLPLAAVKTAVKTKASIITLESLPDGRYLLGDTITAPLDGKFPDYLRVIPKSDAKPSDKPLQFDADLLARAQAALRCYYGTKNGFYRLSHLDGIATMHAGANNAVVVIMPLRDSAYAGHNSDNYQGFMA